MSNVSQGALVRNRKTSHKMYKVIYIYMCDRWIITGLPLSYSPSISLVKYKTIDLYGISDNKMCRIVEKKIMQCCYLLKYS